MQKKRLKMGKDITEEKSFEEILEEFQPLIASNVNDWKNSYESEDIKCICEFYLWKAYLKYDLSTGIGFGYYASIVINHGLLDNLRRYRKHSDELSLNVAAVSDSEETEIINLIADSTDYEEVAANNVIICQIKSNLNEIESEIFVLFYEREKMQSEICRELGIHRGKLSRIIAKINDKIQNLYPEVSL